MESIVCSIKNQECCAGTCPTCLENDDLNEIFPILSEIEEATYSQRTKENKHWVKKQYTDSGADVVAIFNVLSNFQFRSHMYNIYQQFSELKYLKIILKMMKSFSVRTSQEIMRIKIFMKFSLRTLGMKHSLFLLKLATITV